MKKIDVIIIGAGAAGLMCAIEAGKRFRQVMVIDHANKPGKKILMSGGGRCNFTNLTISPHNYLSHNPHFCKSALSRYTSSDFISLVKKHHIPFHEKTAGQLFCDNKSKDILDLLLSECEQENVEIKMNTAVHTIEKIRDYCYKVISNDEIYECESLVIATGGLSIPTMGASPFGYKIAAQFGLAVWPTRAGLVPMTLHVEDKEKYSALSGASIECYVTCEKTFFQENILFTHRGLSGPAILQISSYWEPGKKIKINLFSQGNLLDLLKQGQQEQPQKQLNNFLSNFFTKRIVEVFIPRDLQEKKLHTLSSIQLQHIAGIFTQWIPSVNGTEGYRTAEVTLGGVDCNVLSSKTMEVTTVPGLYFIGEVVDVTGWLGGFNFQWAWSSGWAAGQVV